MQKTQTPSVDDTPSALPSKPSRWLYVLLSIVLVLIAGLVASLASVVVMGVLRLSLGIPTPVELFGDFVLKHIDTGTFIHLLERFQPHPKTGPLGQALLGMIGAGTVLSLLYFVIVQVKLPAQGYRPARREWLTALAFALGMALVAAGLFWNELAQSFIGLPYTWSIVATILGLLLAFGVYGLVLCLVYRVLVPKIAVAGKDGTVQRRRQLLSRAGVAVLGLGAGAGTFGLVKGYLSEYSAYDGMGTPTVNGFTPPITPNSDHYVVTQNTIDPAPNRDLWRLDVTGLVGSAGTYTYAELQQLPSTSRAITLECIANQVNGHLMGTAIWQGVTFRTLLEKHGGAKSNASYVAFYSVDGYVVSQPLSDVLEADALLAWRMNGAELPERHGFPLRALIPGHYGEENPKWITRIELTDHFVGGLYSDQGWYNGHLHTVSRFDRPTTGSRLPLAKASNIGGIAFAGNRGIQRVEVSVDGGSTWNVATLAPALSQDSWVFWSWQWTPLLPGSYTLMARATDGTGQVQTSQKQGTVPNGATGYDSVMVTVG